MATYPTKEKVNFHPFPEGLTVLAVDDDHNRKQNNLMLKQHFLFSTIKWKNWKGVRVKEYAKTEWMNK